MRNYMWCLMNGSLITQRCFDETAHDLLKLKRAMPNPVLARRMPYRDDVFLVKRNYIGLEDQPLQRFEISFVRTDTNMPLAKKTQKNRILIVRYNQTKEVFPFVSVCFGNSLIADIF